MRLLKFKNLCISQMQNAKTAGYTLCASPQRAVSTKHIKDDIENYIFQRIKALCFIQIISDWYQWGRDLGDIILTICWWGDLGLYCVAGSSCSSSLHSHSGLVCCSLKMKLAMWTVSAEPTCQFLPLICRLWAHLVYDFLDQCLLKHQTLLPNCLPKIAAFYTKGAPRAAVYTELDRECCFLEYAI